MRENGGYLDGNDLDIGHLEGLKIRFQAASGLLFSEDGFPEKIDVHPNARNFSCFQVLSEEFAFRRQNDVGRFFPHLFLDERNRHAGQIVAERLKSLEKSALGPVEKPGHPLDV